MIIRVVCRCGVVLVDPHDKEAVRVALGTVLPMKCPRCGEEPVIEIRKKGEDAALPSAAGQEAVGKERVTRREI